MMKRGFGIAFVMALLVLSLPLSVASAHDSNGDNQGNHRHRDKITVCHTPNGDHPVTITISKAAWKAHKAHGDTQGPCPTPPTPPTPTQSVCTFDAASGVYTNGATTGTGPIHFSWTVGSGSVTVPSGYWNQYTAPLSYYNAITGGSVSGTRAVSLSFTQTAPPGPLFSFTGQLTSNTLSGTMAGGSFTATGTVRCTGRSTGSNANDDESHENDAH
jgi:hypothetical protein